MGKMFDSLKREVGKNTGKAISNAIFGDSHSTPYRRVSSGSSGAMERLQKKRLELQKHESRKREKAEIREELNRLDAAVLEAIEELNSQSIPQTAPELIDFMSKLAVQLNATPFNHKKLEGIYHNKFLYALMEKYNQCIFMLETIAPQSPHIAHYKQQLEKRRKQLKWSKIKYSFIRHPLLALIALAAIVILFMIVFAFLASISSGPELFFGIFLVAIIFVLVLIIKIIRS